MIIIVSTSSTYLILGTADNVGRDDGPNDGELDGDKLGNTEGLLEGILETDGS